MKSFVEILEARIAPATFLASAVDGVKYPGVGVHFRSMSSYMMVKAGHKRSLNVSLDFTNAEPTKPGRRRGEMSLREFADQHRAYLLRYEETKTPAAKTPPQ